MRVKPAPGLTIRDPETKKLLPPDGIDVADDSILWTKMLNNGDVVLVKDIKAVSAKEGGKA